MKSTKGNNFYYIVCVIVFLFSCNEKTDNKWLNGVLNRSSVSANKNSRTMGAWKFSCKRISEKSDSINSDFALLFKIENTEKQTHPFQIVSRSMEQMNNVSSEFFKLIESRFSIAFDGKIQQAEICIDRNVDRSKPFIDLLIIFKNPEFDYSDVELTFEDNVFDLGKVIIPLTAS